MADLQVANTILAQLGGRNFTVMTGAKNFIGDTNSLSFRIPGGGGFAKGGINYVKVTLDDSDTYNVVFSRIRGRKVVVVESFTDIYFDQLQSIFTRATGLQTSLGIPAGIMRQFNNRHED